MAKAYPEKIRIVTPTLGCSRWLTRLAQNIQNIRSSIDLEIEWILVCPVESSAHVTVQVQDIGIVITEVSSEGLYSAINKGANFGIQNWSWFTYINDDDLLLPGFIRTLKLLESIDRGKVIIYGKVNLIDSDDKHLGFLPYIRFPKLIQLCWASKRTPFTQQGTLVSRAAFSAMDGFSTAYKYAADMDFWCRLTQTDAIFTHSPNHVASYRMREGQLSSEVENFEKEKARIREKLDLDQRPPVKILVLFLFYITNLDVYLARLMSNSPILGRNVFR